MFRLRLNRQDVREFLTGQCVFRGSRWKLSNEPSITKKSSSIQPRRDSLKFECGTPSAYRPHFRFRAFLLRSLDYEKYTNFAVWYGMQILWWNYVLSTYGLANACWWIMARERISGLVDLAGLQAAAGAHKPNGFPALSMDFGFFLQWK